MTLSYDKNRLRYLLELASVNFSPDGFPDNLLSETKSLLKNIAGPIINYFTNGQPFSISQPVNIGDDKLKFKVQSISGMVILTIDKNGDYVSLGGL